MADVEGQPTIDEMDLGKVMSALADPLRRQVIQDLLVDVEGTERTCTSFNLGVAKSTVTHHFRVLREAGLIWQVDRGNSRKVRLRKGDLDARFPGLLNLLTVEATDAHLQQD